MKGGKIARRRVRDGEMERRRAGEQGWRMKAAQRAEHGAERGVLVAKRRVLGALVELARPVPHLVRKRDVLRRDQCEGDHEPAEQRSHGRRLLSHRARCARNAFHQSPG